MSTMDIDDVEVTINGQKIEGITAGDINLATESRQKTIEAVLRLKDMKEGGTITWQHMEAINHFFGDLLAKFPEPKLLGTVYFKGDSILKTGAMVTTEVKFTKIPAPIFRVWDIVRFDTGDPALMQITCIDENYNNGGAHRYHGTTFTYSTITAFENKLTRATEKDIERWVYDRN